MVLTRTCSLATLIFSYNSETSLCGTATHIQARVRGNTDRTTIKRQHAAARVYLPFCLCLCVCLCVCMSLCVSVSVCVCLCVCLLRVAVPNSRYLLHSHPCILTATVSLGSSGHPDPLARHTRPGERKAVHGGSPLGQEYPGAAAVRSPNLR